MCCSVRMAVESVLYEMAIEACGLANGGCGFDQDILVLGGSSKAYKIEFERVPPRNVM